MRKTVEILNLVSDQGVKVQARRTTIYETGHLIDGGEMPTNVQTELSDGTYVEELMNGQFFDRNAGTMYRPA